MHGRKSEGEIVAFVFGGSKNVKERRSPTLATVYNEGGAV